MYGTNYGYHSGLNESMVKHLHNKVAYLNRFRPLVEGDIVFDISSGVPAKVTGDTREKKSANQET
jgi:hypothetical protein